jgi:GT2 family glycosyltransferase
MKKILLIIVNYKNEQEVKDFLFIIKHQTYKKYIDILVVNNQSSSDVSYMDFIKETNEIIKNKHYNPQKNLGYLSGALYGYRQHRIKNPGNRYEWIVISNTDILMNEDAFEKLFDYQYEEFRTKK